MAEKFNGHSHLRSYDNLEQFNRFREIDMRKMLIGETVSTPEDLSSLREYAIRLGMKAHANLSDPATQERLGQLGFTVIRKDEKLPEVNSYLEVGSTQTDGYPFIDFTHRFAPVSKDLPIDDPENQDFSLSSSSIDFHNLPSGFYLNAVSKDGIFGEFYVGSDSRSDTVMPIVRLPISEAKAVAFERSISLLDSAATSPEALVNSIYQIVSESITEKVVLKANMQDQMHFRVDKLHDALTNGRTVFARTHSS